MLRSEDGGASWIAANSGTEANLYAVAISPDGKTILAVGDDGTLVRLVEGQVSSAAQVASRIAPLRSDAISLAAGAAWNMAPLRSVAISLDGKTALAAGEMGIALVSPNLDETWKEVVSDGPVK
ncbi:hypothetical protein, partial [Stenotrophomonas sp. A3_2]|uniref:hypothetical protein n=1 Tax=Stenotrophomonas sp. A3_2 TaxID=3119978 RepID=UPI002FC3394E